MSKQVWVTVLVLLACHDGPLLTHAIRGERRHGGGVPTTVGARKQQEEREVEQRVLKASKSGKECENALEEMGDTTSTCECITADKSDMTTLMCEDTTCTYCNADVSVCGNPLTAQVYDADGELYSISDMFVYTKGVSETISITSTDCSSDNDAEELICNSCVASVSAVDCMHCELNDCEDGSVYPSFDCSNVEAGAVFDLCDRDVVIPNGSLFEPLGADDTSFYACFPTTAMPTMVPSISPTTTRSPSISMYPTSRPTPSSVSPTVSPSTLVMHSTLSPTNAAESLTSWPTEETTLNLEKNTESNTPVSTSGGVWCVLSRGAYSLVLGLCFLLGLSDIIMIS